MHRLRWLVPLILPLLAACEQTPQLTIESIYQSGFEHPSDITRYQDRWVVTELYNRRLVLLDTFERPEPRYLPAPESGQTLRSPHFVRVDKQDQLWASEGWGDGLVRFSSIDDDLGEKIVNPAAPMRAPHGLCLADGWVYVADSLNSRLLRARLDKLDRWESFADPEKLVAYGRGLRCEKDGLYLSNSYEQREGLNTGQGSNVLRITDFESGQAEILFAQTDTFATGLLKLNDRYLLVSQWVPGLHLVLVDIEQQTRTRLPHPGPDFFAPYGLHWDRETDLIYVAYVGDIRDRQHKGGVVAYRLDWKRSIGL